MHCVHFFFTDGTDGKGFQLVMQGLLRQVSRSGNIITFQLALDNKILKYSKLLMRVNAGCWSMGMISVFGGILRGYISMHHISLLQTKGKACSQQT